MEIFLIRWKFGVQRWHDNGCLININDRFNMEIQFDNILYISKYIMNNCSVSIILSFHLT